MASDAPLDLTTLTVELLSSYVAHNNVRHEDLSGLISTTHAALAKLGTPEPSVEEATAAMEEHEPAVTARKSLANRDHIVSMIDGKPYKSLKRHLSTRGLTPEQYRERYKLPANYPMVAPGYSEERREVAKRLSLGRKPNAAKGAPTPAPEAAEQPAPAPSPAPARKGRERGAAAKTAVAG